MLVRGIGCSGEDIRAAADHAIAQTRAGRSTRESRAVFFWLVGVSKDAAVADSQSAHIAPDAPSRVAPNGAMHRGTFHRRNALKTMALTRETRDNKRSAAAAAKHPPRPLTQHGVGASEAMPDSYPTGFPFSPVFVYARGGGAL